MKGTKFRSRSQDITFTYYCYNNPTKIYLIKVNNRNTNKRCEICSKLTIKTPKRRHWCRSVFIVALNIFHTFY